MSDSRCAVLWCAEPVLKNGARLVEIIKYEIDLCAKHSDRWLASGERKRFTYFGEAFPTQASGALVDFLDRVSTEDRVRANLNIEEEAKRAARNGEEGK